MKVISIDEIDAVREVSVPLRGNGMKDQVFVELLNTEEFPSPCGVMA